MSSVWRGPRNIAGASSRRHLWGEQHRIGKGTNRNHSRANSGQLTSGDNFSRSPLAGDAIPTADIPYIGLGDRDDVGHLVIRRRSKRDGKLHARPTAMPIQRGHRLSFPILSTEPAARWQVWVIRYRSVRAETCSMSAMPRKLPQSEPWHLSRRGTAVASRLTVPSYLDCRRVPAGGLGVAVAFPLAIHRGHRQLRHSAEPTHRLLSSLVAWSSSVVAQIARLMMA